MHLAVWPKYAYPEEVDPLHSLDVDLRLDIVSFQKLLNRLVRPAKVIPQLAAAFRDHTLRKP